METNPHLPLYHMPPSMGMLELSKCFDTSLRSLQRHFRDYGIYDAVGEKHGQKYAPDQVLLIFYLYEVPSDTKLYSIYLAMEKNGHIQKLLEEFGLVGYREKMHKRVLKLKQERKLERQLKRNKAKLNKDPNSTP
jgi:hypothetical protein